MLRGSEAQQEMIDAQMSGCSEARQERESRCSEARMRGSAARKGKDKMLRGAIAWQKKRRWECI
ncbi:MAG: hypothetical protein A2452_07080 [Candidatus Firestonebacteria bacterium RIFOXYC2_FULL_39_67]|nr:MAG: hypothetical protein A2536_04740 [Candidatus Firestonebacteria bacterium RIFOXYD2_FULL_39_29]OGF52052.1 MAG: hypothetical protein A2497_03395 [Candidatus Firestonebacteria bacterium RifOxyC12_full_39_7]OGF54821.1 MAG: hypothetical protein A2452_07080 [Candidatus Firestonebacteria bacterium RIFOXYC2_FULL_39_67]